MNLNLPATVDQPSANTSPAVLLVDDNPAFREVTGEALSVLGYTVECYSTLDEVLSGASRNRSARLLITDVMMGKTNGLELASQVRLISPNIKVLFCSGYPRTALARGGFDISADQFLPKPISLAALAPKIRQLIGPPPPEDEQ